MSGRLAANSLKASTATLTRVCRCQVFCHTTWIGIDAPDSSGNTWVSAPVRMASPASQVGSWASPAFPMQAPSSASPSVSSCRARAWRAASASSTGTTCLRPKVVGNLQPGQTVLVQGNGGVSIFAAQIALAHGARVIATSSSDANLERIRALGVTDGINYRTHPDWEQEVLALTGGRGVDVTIDVAGGDGLNKSVQATKVAGVVAQVGFLTGQAAQLQLMPVIFRQTTIRGIAVAPRTSFDRMNPFLEQHGIQPVIDRVYAFDEAVQAYQHLARGAFGKIVIKVGD